MVVGGACCREPLLLVWFDAGVLLRWRRGAAASVGASVGVAGCASDPPRSSGLRGRQRPGTQGERRGFLGVDDEAGGGLEGAEVGEVVFGEVGGDVSFEDVGVFGGDREVDLVAGVGGDGVAELAGKLGEVLVG